MKIYTPSDAARHAGNKYLGVLIAARFARAINELPRERLIEKQQKLTTQALEALLRMRQALWMNASGPARIDPIGAPRPFDRQNCTEVA